jgi:UTP--glucose-1-phosphate uridylyltransferase
VDIKKAILTAGGVQQRHLPLQTLVDRDGQTKAALCILIEEALAAGIEELAVVVHPGDQEAYRAAAAAHASRLHFVEQPAPRGYGHAIACARDFTGRDPFLLMVGDHLYVNRGTKACAQQLVEVARSEGCAVSAVQATHESKLPYYGAVGGRLAGSQPGLYRIEVVCEKPTPTEAERRLIVPGLRAGHYLCFFGMHVLPATVMDLLVRQLGEAAPETTITLSAALAALAATERYLAAEMAGRRFDIGVKHGLLVAQLALALEGQERDEVLADLVELLALRSR